jgi:hypothetical protein
LTDTPGLALNGLILIVQSIIGGYVIRMESRLRRIEERTAAVVQKIGGVEE